MCKPLQHIPGADILGVSCGIRGMTPHGVRYTTFIPRSYIGWLFWDLFYFITRVACFGGVVYCCTTYSGRIGSIGSRGMIHRRIRYLVLVYTINSGIPGTRYRIRAYLVHNTLWYTALPMNITVPSAKCCCCILPGTSLSMHECSSSSSSSSSSAINSVLVAVRYS